MRRRIPFIAATLFAPFHIITVVVTLLSSRGAGEGQAMLVALIDFPLVWLLQTVPGGGHILYNSVRAYILFFSVVGTLMYAAAVGYGAGAVLGNPVWR
jgi:hypothetical protein